VLVAVFVGASTAAAATALAKPVDVAASNAGALDTSFTYANRPPNANRTPAPNPAPPATPTTAPATITATSTTSTPQPNTTTSAPPKALPSSAAPPRPAGTDVEQVVALANQARADSGCAALTVDAKLTAAATEHSTDMSTRDYFSHTTPEGVAFDQRIENAGYATPGAENIARGQESAEDVMDAWMKSKGHRANILNCQLTTIGVGLSTDGWYWTQDFGY
jgi:uncharacterized protein YkwD